MLTLCVVYVIVGILLTYISQPPSLISWLIDVVLWPLFIGDAILVLSSGPKMNTQMLKEGADGTRWVQRNVTYHMMSAFFEYREDAPQEWWDMLAEYATHE